MNIAGGINQQLFLQGARFQFKVRGRFPGLFYTTTRPLLMIREVVCNLMQGASAGNNFLQDPPRYKAISGPSTGLYKLNGCYFNGIYCEVTVQFIWLGRGNFAEVQIKGLHSNLKLSSSYI